MAERVSEDIIKAMASKEEHLDYTPPPNGRERVDALKLPPGSSAPRLIYREAPHYTQGAMDYARGQIQR